MASANLKHLTDANFDKEVLQSSAPTLVDFWATWCQPCLAIAPHVEAMATQFHGKLNVGKMDIDHNQKTPTHFEIRSIPTLLMFHGGKVVGQLVGAVPKAKLEQFIKDGLKKSGVAV
jgi:thioredoxin 1